MSVLDGRMHPPKPPGAPRLHTSPGQGANWGGAGQTPRAMQQGAAAADGQQQQQQQQEGEGAPEGADQQQEDAPEQETLHRLCPTYASDINSPLRHVRTRIYFTSESHIHSLVNVLRYCHLGCPDRNSSGPTNYGTGASSISKTPSSSNVLAVAAVAATAGSGSGAAAAAVQVAADGAAVDAVTAAVAAVGVTDAAAGAGVAAGGKKPKGSVFASPAVAAAAAAGGTAAVDGSISCEVLAGVSSVASSIAGQQQQQQQLLTPEGQTLLAGTDEFDYLTHIVFRMYENKVVRQGAWAWACGQAQQGGVL